MSSKYYLPYLPPVDLNFRCRLSRYLIILFDIVLSGLPLSAVAFSEGGHCFFGRMKIIFALINYFQPNKTLYIMLQVFR